MDFKTYWQNLDSEAKKRLADALGTSVAYLSQIANGHRKASPSLTLAIEHESGMRVPRHLIRPDVYPQAQPAVALGALGNG